MLLEFFVVVVILFIAARVYIAQNGPKSVKQKLGSMTMIEFGSTMPTVLSMYLRVILSMGNITKPSLLKEGETIPRIEATVSEFSVDKARLAKFRKFCGYQKDDAGTIPVPFVFPMGYSLIGTLVTADAFAIKPVASVVHICQHFEILEPITEDMKFSIRAITKTTEGEKGMELHLMHYLYVIDGDSTRLVCRATGIELLPTKKKKKGKSAPKVFEVHEFPEEDEDTKVAEWKLAEDSGRQYGAGSGDYNPWHMNAVLGKLFGHKRHIMQGVGEMSKAFAGIQNAGFAPDYPLRLSCHFKRPLYLPNTVVFTQQRESDSKVSFDIYSKDGKSLHAVGSVEHIEELSLEDN
eukprot:TRINITY_DN8867_c0_g1_i1.p1 TRINITY_DN8867_c0_g1~~TRINITY_DN8867_c0_g1_i1.p1  ORF type:complete len:369 (+),score=121.58 TRINITY_DN8867_c0_g1_i1:59-1108(+)